MSKKFELNYAGVGELLKSPEMIAVLEANAGAVADNAGNGYSVHIGPHRANVSVRTANKKAEQDNYKNNTLLKAAGKAGLKMKG